MLKNISMRHLIPLLLLSGGLIFVIFFYTISLPAAEEQTKDLSRQQARTLLQSQQGRFSDLLVLNDELQLDKEIYYASTDPGTYRLLILDENNVITHANRSRLRGRSIADTNLPINEHLLKQASINRTIFLELPDEGNDRFLTGYAALPFERNGVSYIWHLVIIRDYKRTADAIVAIAAYPSELLATFLLVVSILAIIVLRKHLDDRTQPLLIAAARLSKGEKDVRSDLAGSDEFSEIAAAFDQMAGRIDANRVELENARENAEKANAAKNHFLSHMSHEIQTPLTTLLGFLDLLKDTKLDSDASLYLRTMETSTRTLSHLVNDLLETNRLEAGTITPRPQPFCLNTVIQETLDSLLPRARDKGLSVKVICSESDPIWIDSDARIFRQILLNLLGNAIQYTDDGNISVAVESHTKDGDTMLQISVNDTGIGIDQKDQPYIFERFFRADVPAVRAQKGAGIGLTICKDFVNLLHGDLTVESENGVGTSFVFRVKVHAASPEENFDFADLSHRDLESLNILLVEHTPVTQVLFRSILEKSGHNVDICSGAKAAIKFAKDRLIYPHLHPISLIIMDLHLPKTDGFQAAEEIRGLGGMFAHIPIVATSTLDDQYTRDRCLDGLFDGFIAKPINRQFLIEEVFRLTHMANNGSDEPAQNSAGSIG